MIVFDAKTNDMHLRDMGCKGCGSRGSFKIELSCMADVHDGWIDHGVGTDVWGLDAKCVCTRCGRSGTVADFTVMGLDDLIETGHLVSTEGK